jgi:hypothetical protein
LAGWIYVRGFLSRQQLQQPIVLNFISRRITFRRRDQSPIVRKVFVVDETLHCDLQGVHGRISSVRLLSHAVERGIVAQTPQEI